MGDTVLRQNEQAAPAGYPDWTQEAMERASFQKGELKDAYGLASGATPVTEPGLRGSRASWDQFFPPEASFDEGLKRSKILNGFEQDAKDQGQNVILVTPNDITADAPYETRIPIESSVLKRPDIEPPGLSATEQFRQLAEENGLAMPPDDLADLARGLSSRPGAAAALPIDAVNIRAVKDLKPEDIIDAPADTCVVTLPTDKGIMPIQYPNNLAILDGAGNYSPYAPIYEQKVDGTMTGYDPKSDMLIYVGSHEIDHCTNAEDSIGNPFPEYDSDTHAGAKYAEAFGKGLASDETVPYFVRSIRAEATVLDQQGELDKYVLNGIVSLPGEGKPLTPAEQLDASVEIKEFRKDLFENAGVSEKMMQDPDQLSENRYALYNKTEDMLRTGELDDTPYAKKLAEVFTDGAKRYQPENYNIDPRDAIEAYPVLPMEAYGTPDPALSLPPLQGLPNFNVTPAKP